MFGSEPLYLEPRNGTKILSICSFSDRETCTSVSVLLRLGTSDALH